MKKLISGLLASGFLLAGPGLAEEVNNGQDFTRPLDRMDLRFSYTGDIEIPNRKDAFSSTAIVRFDIPRPLWDTGWTFYYRTDIPFSMGDIPSLDNPKGDKEYGLGDWFNQFALIAPQGPNVDYPFGIDAWGFGVQLTSPTATHDQMGYERFTLTPFVGAKWNITSDFWIGVLVKYRQSVGDYVGRYFRPEISELQLQPLMNFTLKDGWFITFYETALITWENSKDKEDRYDWDIPADVMLGKATDKCFANTKRCVYSLQGIVYPEKDRKDYTVWFRYGSFF